MKSYRKICPTCKEEFSTTGNIETLCRSCHAKEHNLSDNINKV